MKIRFLFTLILPIIFFLAFTLALNSSGQGAPLDDNKPSQGEKVMEWQGSYGGFKEPTTMVIKNQDAWQNLYDAILNGEVAPMIDFSRFMVVSIFMGERMTGGHGINILRTEEIDEIEIMEYEGKAKGKLKSLTQIKRKTFVVEYEEISPDPGQFVTMAITSPYHIKVVKKSDLPVIFIRYKK